MHYNLQFLEHVSDELQEVEERGRQLQQLQNTLGVEGISHVHVCIPIKHIMHR